MRINSLAVHTTVASAAFFLSSIRPVAADTTNLWKCQVAGLRVVAPSGEGKDKMGAFNRSPGVTVALLLTAPEGNIVSVNQEASKLISFTDDKGTDLLGDSSRRGFRESVLSRFNRDSN